MNITEIKNDSTDLHVKVVIPAGDVSAEVEKELLKLSKTAKIDGFRVGKVPVSFLKKKYGSTLRADTVRNCIGKAVNQIIKDRDLRTFMNPEADEIIDEEGKDLEFVLRYQLLPEVIIPNFSKISLEKPILKIEDQDIEHQLQNMVKFAKFYNKEKKGKAAKGDQVAIDAIGYANGKEFPGGKLDAHKLVLGSGAFIPGFEDQLIGAKAGDKVSVNVIFPENYHAKDLAGKPAEFKVTVLSVYSESKVEIDDEFAKSLRYENLNKLKEEVKKGIEWTYADQVRTFMKMKLFDCFEDQIKFDIPKALLDREVSTLEEQIGNSEEDEELKGKSSEEKRAYFSKLASRRVRIGLMLAEYAKQKNLQIDKKDISDAIMAQARNFPGREREVIDLYLKNHDALESLKGSIFEDKAVTSIFENEIKLKDKYYSKKEIDEMIDEADEEHAPDHVHGPDCEH